MATMTTAPPGGCTLPVHIINASELANANDRVRGPARY